MDSKHTFSFGRYNNPKRTNFGDLIVFNEDVVSPGKGFGAHPHENAEIVSLVLKGKLKHEDSKGNKGIIGEGELQRISAGSGIWHSEYNASDKNSVHFLQIWLEPKELNVEPSYEQKKYSSMKKNSFNLIVGDKKGVISINQDARFFLGEFSSGFEFNHLILDNKLGYLFVIEGKIELDNLDLENGDSVLISNIKEFSMKFLFC